MTSFLEKRFSLPSETSAEYKSPKSIINKYKVFETKSQQTVNFLNISKKTFSFKILNEIKKLELLREQEINEIKNETKRNLNMLDDETNDIYQKSQMKI